MAITRASAVVRASQPDKTEAPRGGADSPRVPRLTPPPPPRWVSRPPAPPPRAAPGGPPPPAPRWVSRAQAQAAALAVLLRDPREAQVRTPARADVLTTCNRLRVHGCAMRGERRLVRREDCLTAFRGAPPDPLTRSKAAVRGEEKEAQKRIALGHLRRSFTARGARSRTGLAVGVFCPGR